MPKCQDCANMKYEVKNIDGIATIINTCFNMNIFNPPRENEEHICKMFTQKSGISMWDSMTDVQRQQVIDYAKEFSKTPENNLTEEESILFFVTNLKKLDKNSN